MPVYYTISAFEALHEPPSSAINQAFSASVDGFRNGLQMAGMAVPPVRWVGPRVRVTRIGEITRAANVLEIDGPYAQAQLDGIAAAMTTALGYALGSQWTVSFHPFSESENGSLSWWACLGYDASQCAGVTATQDRPGSIDENPVGPGTAGSSNGILVPLVVIGGILGAIFLFRRNR